MTVILHQDFGNPYRSIRNTNGLSTTYHPGIDGQSDHTIQTLEDMLRSCAIKFGRNWDTHLSLVEFSDNNSYHSSLKCAPFEALYERKCQTPISWAEVCTFWQEKQAFTKIRRIVRDCRTSRSNSLSAALTTRTCESSSHVLRVKLKKFLADVNLHIPLEEVKIDGKLHFVEEPMENMDREVKKLKKKRIPIVKVRWNTQRGP
nr:putative reverse transcriptase domain-containing protein [Tanacetum cinerariifolium]